MPPWATYSCNKFVPHSTPVLCSLLCALMLLAGMEIYTVRITLQSDGLGHRANTWVAHVRRSTPNAASTLHRTGSQDAVSVEPPWRY